MGAALFYGIGRLYEKWAGRRGLGGGDVKLMAMIGAFLGVGALPLVILVSAGLGTLTGLIRVLGQGPGPRGQWRTISLPYGPFLAAGAWVLSLLGGKTAQPSERRGIKKVPPASPEAREGPESLNG